MSDSSAKASVKIIIGQGVPQIFRQPGFKFAGTVNLSKFKGKAIPQKVSAIEERL